MAPIEQQTHPVSSFPALTLADAWSEVFINEPTMQGGLL